MTSQNFRLRELMREAGNETQLQLQRSRQHLATVEERLPPRIRIRSGAALEMPHTMVLMDDRDDRVLGPLENAKHRMKKVYDFDLMLGGGHVTGWRVDGVLRDTAHAALDSLADPELQREKYGEAAENGPMSFAIGDGNHSLAAAKRFWEQIRDGLPIFRSESTKRCILLDLK